MVTLDYHELLEAGVLGIAGRQSDKVVEIKVSYRSLLCEGAIKTSSDPCKKRAGTVHDSMAAIGRTSLRPRLSELERGGARES